MDKMQTAQADKASTVDRDIERLRKELVTLRGYLMNEPSAEVLVEFDAKIVDQISDILGSSSPMIEAYEYATVGEASGLMNVPEEGLEGITHDSQRETLRQRQRVLESCVSDLETRRAAASAIGAKKAKVSGPRVSDYMSKTIRAVTMDATLKEVGRLLQEWKIGSVLVQSGDEYVGSVTETELAREVVGGNLDPATTTVRTCMREPIINIDSSDHIVEAVRLMKNKATRHLAVVENDRVVGVVSVSDIIRYYSGV
ncbi:MAG: CBS domain-containing protein [Nitrospirota bacterium]|nr:MAG: CBS domain-containing protein [Nitrospirota bacterium]